MIDPTLDEKSSWFTWGERDCWPFIRILIVASALAAAAHSFAGWSIGARRFAAMPGHVFGVLSVLAMLSFALAELYLLALIIPLYVVGVLNDWFYDLSRWTCQVVLRVNPGAFLMFLGLSGEIVLFAGLGLLIKRVLLLL